MIDLIDELLEIEADAAAERVHQSEVRHASADDWPQIVNYVRDVMGTSGMASLRSVSSACNPEISNDGGYLGSSAAPQDTRRRTAKKRRKL